MNKFYNLGATLMFKALCGSSKTTKNWRILPIVLVLKCPKAIELP